MVCSPVGCYLSGVFKLFHVHGAGADAAYKHPVCRDADAGPVTEPVLPVLGELPEHFHVSRGSCLVAEVTALQLKRSEQSLHYAHAVQTLALTL
jgi:hypothetical protein